MKLVSNIRILAPWLGFGLVLVFTAWVYWPGHTGPALLDDRTSVLTIGEMGDDLQYAFDYLSSDSSGPLGRPVSVATFVLEKILLGDSIHISKLVNIGLHLLNGALVTWLLLLLFRFVETPSYRWLAIILGCVWLLSPLYVSTVLYAVQRMAMLATTFMLLACIAYCQWRESLLQGRFSWLALAAMAVSILLGLFSKENAILVMPVILLIEALWYQFRGVGGAAIPWLRVVTLSLIVMGAVGVMAGFLVKVDSIGFGNRPFTMYERVLTEGRILWDYVRQLLLPNVLKMGIYHDDIVFSKSWFEPVETLYAALGWLLTVTVASIMLVWSWGRRLVFGVFLFLVGHSLESTVFPLELYFEHRNYFPGIGLLISAGVLYSVTVKRWSELSAPLLVYFACYALWLASLASSQVQVWSSRPLLTFNHYNAHPNSFRATTDMAVLMAMVGDIESARRYSGEALALNSDDREGDVGIRDIALSCLAGERVDPGLIDSLGTIKPSRPFGSGTSMLAVVSMLEDDKCPSLDRLRFADRMVEIFLAPGAVATAPPAVYISLSLLENKLQRYHQALEYITLYLQRFPDEGRASLMKLHFATGAGESLERAAALSHLQQLDAQGKLTAREQETLSLYLEN